MSEELPPNIPIFPTINFNSSFFNSNTDGLTLQTASQLFLRFPSAQGSENLLTTTINGVLTANSTTNLNSSVNIPNNDMFVRGIRIGYGANSSNNRNTVVGISSAGNITSGNDNVFLGAFAGNQNTSASSNVLIGSFCGRNITSGSLNTFVGRDAGTVCTTGVRNTYIGREAGYFNNNGSDNICIGSNSDVSGSLSNCVAIGNYVKAFQANTILLGLPSQKTIIPGGADIYRPLSINDTTSSANRSIISSFYNFYDSGVAGSLNQNGTLYNQSGSMYLQNTVNSGNINFVLNDPGGVQNTPLQLLNSSINLNKQTIISANNSLSMSGTGIVSQFPIPIGATTQNILKRTTIQIDSGSPSTGTSTSGLEIYDSNGKGLFFLPNCLNGALSSLNRTNDAAIVSRATQGNNAVTLTNWATGGLTNGIRVATSNNTNSTQGNASTVISCGNNVIGGLSELRMTYDLSSNTYSTSFNYPINFNPTNIYGNFPSSRRLLSGLGVLNFVDISNNGSLGLYQSDIYTNSVSISGGIVGFYYNCNIPNGYHIFSAADGAGNVSTPIYYGSALTSVSNTFIVRNATTPSNRFDIAVDGSQNVNIRARSATSSTTAKININCDTVNAVGGVTNQSVLTINPTNLEMKRPIQFNYITRPGSLNQLGYIDTLIFDPTTVLASASVRNFSNFIITDPGSYNIEILFSLVASGSHNLSACVFGCDNSSAILSTIDSPTNYTTSLVGFNTISLSSTTTSYLKINFNINFVSSNNNVYVNYLLNYSGGGNTTIDATGKITRLG